VSLAQLVQIANPDCKSRLQTTLQTVLFRRLSRPSRRLISAAAVKAFPHRYGFSVRHEAGKRCAGGYHFKKLWCRGPSKKNHERAFILIFLIKVNPG
jgi:hypothetical protein